MFLAALCCPMSFAEQRKRHGRRPKAESKSTLTNPNSLRLTEGDQFDSLM